MSKVVMGDASDLMRLLEWRVSDDQIDHNGHMGMTNYALKGGEASLALAGKLDLSLSALRAAGLGLWTPDSYIRYYREQMLGAPLVMVGGVVGATPERLTVYHELHNRETGDRSAVITQEVGLIDSRTREPRRFSEAVLRQARAQPVTIPSHGRPRSIKLGDPGSKVSMEELERRGLATGEGGFGKPGAYSIATEDCDEYGFLKVPLGQGVTWARRRSLEEMQQDPHWIQHMKTLQERKIGWAAMENRVSLFSIPRDGDTLRSFSAVVAVHSKTRHRKIWTFNVTTGALAGIHQQIDLAFDLVKRKGVEILPDMLVDFGEHLAPDLA